MIVTWLRINTATFWAVFAIAIATTSIIYYIQTTLSDIEQALPLQILEQERDISRLTQDLADLVRVVQVMRAGSHEHTETVLDMVKVLDQHLREIRGIHKLDNLVGAATIHAVVAPALFDINTWLDNGIHNFAPGSDEVLALVETRATDAYNQVRTLSVIADQTAYDTLSIEASKISAFRNNIGLGLLLLLGTAGTSIFFLLRRQLVNRQLIESEAMLSAFLDHVPVAISIKDVLGRYIRINRYAGDLFGVRGDEVRGKMPDSLVSKNLAKEFSFHDRAVLTSGEPKEQEFIVPDKNGHRFFRHIRFPIHDPKGHVIAMGAVGMEVTAQRRSEERFQDFAEIASDYLWEMDEHLRFSFVSAGYARVTGGSPSHILGKTREEFWRGKVEDEAERDSHLDILKRREPFSDFNITWRRPSSGEQRFLRMRGKPLFDANGKFLGYRGIVTDVTKQKLVEKQNEYFAYYDSLTDLPNRKLLMDRLHQAIALAERRDRYGAVLFLDLDHFKNVNDSLGHSYGDDLLKQVASRIANVVREEDTVSRIGGDEFVVMLFNLGHTVETTAKDAQVVAEKIQQVLRGSYVVQGHELQITTSIGIALFPIDNCTIDDLLKNADTAMYGAKEDGRNAIRFFSQSMQHSAEQRLIIQNRVHRAVERRELVLDFQPQLDAFGKINGAEALLRIRDSRGVLMMPADFIAVAENSGLILPIGEWVLTTACQYLRTWLDAGIDPALLKLSINVNMKQFHQPEFTALVQRALTETGVDASHLELEITESIIMADVENTIKRMCALKKMGLCLSIDDFGTGYSSLSYLKRLPLDRIKIDQSFVRDIASDENDATIVSLIIAMAEKFGLDVVAEGVESEEAYQFLRRQKCTGFQGFYFYRPLQADEYLNLLKSKTV